MTEDMRADGLEYAEEQRRRRLSQLRDEDGNPLYQWDDEDYDRNKVECACGIWWPASDMVDGQCPECRESDA